MKLSKLSLIASFFCSTATFAFNCASISPYDLVVSVPFKDRSISNGKYEDGICFSYQLNQAIPKKIVCELSQLESAWLVYFEKGILRTSDDILRQDFKNKATVIITNKGESKIISKNMYQIHVDDNEVVAFHHDRSSENSTAEPQATCRYKDDIGN